MRLVRGEHIWQLHATHGVPLELSIPMLADRGMCPTWVELIEAAERDGMKRDAIARRLHALGGDAYPPETATAIRARLDRVLARPPEAP